MEKREKIEIDIELKDLFNEFFRRWRLIVCCALVGGVLLGAISFIKDANNTKTSVGPNVETETEKKDVTEELNIDELEEVISAVQLKAQIDAESQYISKSILMQINPFSTDRILLEYRMDGADAATALSSCQTWMKQGGFLNANASDEEKIYIGELVTADVNGEILLIQVLHKDADACEELALELKNKLTQYMADLKTKGLSYEVTLLQETAAVVVYDELHQFQDNYLDESIADQEELAKMKADMNAKQVAAYLKMERDVFDRGENSSEEITEVELTEESNEESQEVQAVKVTVDISKVLIGMIFGAALAVVYIFMAYLMTGKLRTVGEIEKFYDVKLLGTIQNIINGKEEQKLAAASIYIQCQEYGISTVYACGSKIADISPEILNSLKVELSELGIALEVGGDVTGHADALLAASKVGNVLLVEEKRVSEYKNILKSVQMCVNNHIRVLGAIVVE